MKRLTSHSKGEKVTAKAHGGTIDITGITIASVDDKVRLQAVDTYFDPLDMFRQIAPYGVVNKQVIDRKVHSVDKAAALDDQTTADTASKAVEEHVAPKDTVEVDEPVKSAQDIVDSAATQGEGMKTEHVEPKKSSVTCPVSGRSRTPSSASSSAWEKVSNPAEEAPRSQYSSALTGNVEGHIGHKTESSTSTDEIDQHLASSASKVHPHPKDMEVAVQPNAGEAVVAAAYTEETRLTHEEMSRITSSECPFLMNRE